jgi:SRSO17 transposase
VRLWRERWKIEQGYQQMREELGLDRFEGRGWRGFHHHCALVMLAFGFLALEQRRAVQTQGRSKKKPAVRKGSADHAALRPPRPSAPAGAGGKK